MIYYEQKDVDNLFRKIDFIGYEQKSYYNGGIFAYKLTCSVKRLLIDWQQNIDRHPDNDMYPGHFGDQYFLNLIIKKHIGEGLKIHVIPARKWNARCYLYRQFKADNLLDEISIFHGRPVLSKLIKMNVTPLSFQDKLTTIRLRFNRILVKFFLRHPYLNLAKRKLLKVLK